jgi:hypothetical protein
MIQKNILAASIASAMLLTSSHVLAATASGEFDATAELAAGLEVNCGETLDFGTIAVPSAYEGGATVTVEAADGAGAETDGNLVVTGGASIACTISGSVGSATVALSQGESAFAGGTLSDVALTLEDSTATMLADITVSALAGDDFFIGGTLTVPAIADEEDLGTYTSEPITVTVTDDGVANAG